MCTSAPSGLTSFAWSQISSLIRIKSAARFNSTAWLMYDTAFRHMAASNISAPWSKDNEQLYNDILKEETLPYCISCHSYSHRTIGCTVRSKSNHPPRSLPCPTPLSLVPALSTSRLDPNNPSHLPSAEISTDDFAAEKTAQNKQHICNRPDCGGNHPGLQCPKGT